MLVELGDVGWAGLLHQTVRGCGGPTQETVPHRGAAVTTFTTLTILTTTFTISNTLAVIGNVTSTMEELQAVCLVAEDLNIISTWVNLNFT